MKLITEQIEELEYINESHEDGSKSLYITGRFLQANEPNRNKRIYSEEILAKEVANYTKNLIEQGRSFGELSHPSGPTINLDRVSHIITELKKDGHHYIGKAKLMETPCGNIAKALINGGGKLGVSSRGMGSLKLNKEGFNEVQDDFKLATAADIVADPSVATALVDGIMEGKEWVYSNGLWSEEILVQEQKIIKKTSSKQLEEQILKTFNKFLGSL